MAESLRARKIQFANIVKKIIAFVGCLFILMFLILRIENLLLSSLLAFVISYLLGPIVNSLERRGIHRVVAALFDLRHCGGFCS